MSKVITPVHFPAPRGYANGILSTGHTLFISGQVAWDKDARIVSTDFTTQYLTALDNVIAVVREAGGGTEHITKLVVYVLDLDAYRAATRALGEGWRARMGRRYPAMTMVKVAGLLEPGALVEIDGVAMLPEPPPPVRPASLPPPPDRP